jgi:hypothetical protein
MIAVVNVMKGFTNIDWAEQPAARSGRLPICSLGV